MEETLIPPPYALETATAYFWTEEGVIFIFNKKTIHHKLEHAIENIEIAKSLANKVAMLMLIDIGNIRSMDKTTRDKYAMAGDTNNVRGIALVTRSDISSMLGNFFIRFNKPQTPTRLFSSHIQAKKWLLQLHS